jgi:hypothetical protein
VRVGILLTFEKHLHHRITSPRWALKTTFTAPLYIEMDVRNLESENVLVGYESENVLVC